MTLRHARGHGELYRTMNYEPTIGLEIHTELKTKTKMFCGCLNDPEEKHPNINICPICLGHPGTLPVINKKAVESVLKLGLALNCTIPEISKFDRKNYFYPDLPKGYQISQYDKPLVIGGELNGVHLTRVHLEEDTGRLVHVGSPSTGSGQSASLIDFNRAGVPLMEIVTEPDIKSGEQAVKFGQELQLILRYLEISDADMEKGQMRVEANISLGVEGKLGIKVEIKNLNSFRAVAEAIDYEIKRQTQLFEEGKQVIQETRGWDDANKKTVSQRFKEESHDYRYFPEPDLPPLILRTSDVQNIDVNFGTSEVQKLKKGGGAAAFDLEAIKISIPEMPAQKRERFIKEYGLSTSQVEILVSDRRLAQYFEEAVSELKSQEPNSKLQTLFNYLTSDLLGLINQEGIGLNELKIKPEGLAHLAALIDKGELSSRMAKDILLQMFQTGLDPHEIIKEKGISQVSDEEVIKKAIQEVVAENPTAVADYEKGKQNALQFLIGKTMAKLKGQGNPEIISKLLNEELTEGE